jgi:hypothetical protein
MQAVTELLLSTDLCSCEGAGNSRSSRADARGFRSVLVTVEAVEARRGIHGSHEKSF